MANNRGRLQAGDLLPPRVLQENLPQRMEPDDGRLPGARRQPRLWKSPLYSALIYCHEDLAGQWPLGGAVLPSPWAPCSPPNCWPPGREGFCRERRLCLAFQPGYLGQSEVQVISRLHLCDFFLLGSHLLHLLQSPLC